ncbi:exodeoxyribonuclease VII small subunit [Pseudotabrizicola algicola]|uniref:Exodeoxyribonuclease 7 small subunit n=1 Tax=Pseudotabrizicola algicola TaxID=2709381 RepID=A0A6B3RRB5_9RHOB|nr:exodeoxyribonuclease VII small subunit [Pseudotabrizicola algicola]NEX48001.1 exodeoxyribonuclease VII small subunit [Pseudotabrizicola algicola]
MTDRPAEKPVGDMSFEEAMAALEQVVGQLERGDVALDASIALYERGAALKAHCEAKLKDAEEKVELIRAAEGRAIGTTPAEGM